MRDEKMNCTTNAANNLHHELVSTSNQGGAVGVVECLRDVLAKGIAGAARRDSPALAIVRVRPEEIAHRTLVRYFLRRNVTTTKM
jgi:hypothetical protein